MNNSFYSIFLFICFSITVVPHSLISKGHQPKKTTSEKRIKNGPLEYSRPIRFAANFPSQVKKHQKNIIERQERRNQRAQEAALALIARRNALARIAQRQAEELRQIQELQQARQARQTIAIPTAHRVLPNLAGFNRQPTNLTPAPPAIVRANRHTATPTTVSIFNINNAGSFSRF